MKIIIIFFPLFMLLVARPSAADATGNPGRSIMGNLDEQKIWKPWKIVYVRNKLMHAGYKCWTVEFQPPIGKAHQIVMTFTNKSDGQDTTVMGECEIYDGHFLNVTFPAHPEWSVPFGVLATDYERYLIISGCPKDFGCVVQMHFQTWFPSDETLQAAKDALAKTGIDFKDFESFCPNNNN